MFRIPRLPCSGADVGKLHPRITQGWSRRCGGRSLFAVGRHPLRRGIISLAIGHPEPLAEKIWPQASTPPPAAISVHGK